MRAKFFSILIAGAVGLTVLAQDTYTNVPATKIDPLKTNARAAVDAAAAAKAAVNVAAPAPDAVETNTYARLVRQELELSVKHKLLKDLADELALRSQQKADLGKVEPAQWEADLAGELRGRSNILLTELNDATAQRLSLETAIRPALGGPVEERKTFSYDELAYLTELDQRLVRLRQALFATSETAQALQLELQTNKTEESIVRVTELIELNTRSIGQLEKEQADLELQRLQFRALRK